MGLRGTVRLQRSFLVFIIGLSLTGCSIHPLPDDVTGVPTYIIVRQVRCETRQAVIQSLFNYLTTESNMHDNLLDENSYNIGLQVKREYDRNRDSITKFDPASLTGTARKIVGLLYHTGIAYNYDLTGLEINNIDPAADFLRPLPKTTVVSLGLTGNFDRQRQNERLFTITDNFGDLISKVHENYCTNHLVEANYVYPIAGRVGIDRMVHDFVLLTLFGNLGGTISGKDPTKVSGPPTMVDQLQFLTTIGGGATPKVVFIPLGPAFSFSDVSFPVSASRKDTHLLTVGLYLDKTGAKEIGRVRAGLFTGRLITASGSTAEQGAAMAVEQFLELKIFKPTVVVGQ
jgi:hypothetical protein